MEYKKVVQFARYKNNYEYLNLISEEDVDKAIEYSLFLEDPKIGYHLKKLKKEISPKELQIPKTEKIWFFYPRPIESSTSVALELLVYNFLIFLQKEYYAVILENDRTFSIETWNELELKKTFIDFIQKEYHNENLKNKLKFVDNISRFNFSEQYDNTKNLRDLIIKEKMFLVPEAGISGFGDSVKSLEACSICGRFTIKEYLFKARQEEVTKPKQRSQSDVGVDNLRACPLCLFAARVNPVRIDPNVVILRIGNKITERISSEYIASHLLGIPIGPFLRIPLYGDDHRAVGVLAMAYVIGAQLPKQIIEKEDIYLFTDKEVVKLNKNILSDLSPFKSFINEKALYIRDIKIYLREAIYSIMKGNIFFAFYRIAQANAGARDIEEIRYKLFGGDSMLKEEYVIHGMSLAIDNLVKKEKTEFRKVAYSLSNRYEVLFRLAQSGYSKRIIKESIWNKFSLKCLKILLSEIDMLKETEGGVEVNHEVLRAIYDYVFDTIAERNDRKFEKFMNNVKYDLLARNPNLIRGD